MRVATAVASVLAVCCLAVLVLQAPMARPPSWGAFEPGAFVVSVAFLAILACGVAAAAGRLWIGLTLVAALSVVLAVANWLRIRQLGEPLEVNDLEYLGQPAELVSMADRQPLLLGVAGLLAVVGLCVLVLRRGPLRAPLPRSGRWLSLRALTVGLMVATLVSAAHFNRPANPVRVAYETAGVSWANWSTWDNARINGFLGALLNTMPVDAMERPEGYGEQAVAELVDDLDTGAGAVAGGDQHNLVVVLSESFADPQQLPGVSVEPDPLVHLREQAPGNTSGVLDVQYGTGTSVVEFELLTGQDTALFTPNLGAPYNRLVPGHDSYPSMVSALAGIGYRTLAVHGYHSGFYHRDEVYDAFGFDEFVRRAELPFAERVGSLGAIGDGDLFDLVVEEIEGRDEPVFAHVVTMQNHVPVDHGDFGSLDAHIDGEPAELMGQWAAGVADSDAELADLLDALEATGEPTTVAYFGDHFPTILSASALEAAGEKAHRTPLLVWSTQPGATRDVGVVRPSSVGGLLFERAGMRVPGMLALQTRLREEVGAPVPGGLVRPDGERVDVADLSPQQRRLYDEVMLAQFDLSIGERHGEAGLWRMPPVP